ncbi:WD40-repeat-containing domain protein [Geopyxis carbonaria]|nr:WD40-repeat-containing domain protein [Geopyxis carbonaria]
MAKRKRDVAGTVAAAAPAPAAQIPSTSTSKSPAIHLQVITGTYEKTLHGFIVSIPSAISPKDSDDASSVALPATFSDTFLFTAHTSPLRALRISPAATNSTKRILATSSADERINLYMLSTLLPPVTALSALKPLSGRNKHLGALHHHLNTPTALLFTPNRSKLFSAGADGQIHILRTRDWSLLSTLKAPKPKPKPINYAKDYGEANGPRIDTFGSEGYGGGTGAINDIALHPSQKILLSVGAGERAVRMWNLMTGRKAGVLVFDRKHVPSQFGSEGNRIGWSTAGEEYAVMFGRGVVIFGMDSKPKAQIAPEPLTKLHAMRYVTLPSRILKPEATEDGDKDMEVLMIATEDGRVLFYATSPTDAEDPATAPLLGTLGGRSLGMPTRIKDLVLITAEGRYFVVTACSDGVVRIWDLCGHGSSAIEVAENETESSKKPKTDDADADADKPKEADVAVAKQVGTLVGMYETARRITCMDAMVMAEGEEEPEDEEMADVQNEDESSDDEDSE